MIFHVQKGKYYARGGRHRTFARYHLGMRSIDVKLLQDFELDELDRYYLEHRCVSIADLVEEPLPKAKDNTK